METSHPKSTTTTTTTTTTSSSSSKTPNPTQYTDLPHHLFDYSKTPEQKAQRVENVLTIVRPAREKLETWMKKRMGSGHCFNYGLSENDKNVEKLKSESKLTEFKSPQSNIVLTKGIRKEVEDNFFKVLEPYVKHAAFQSVWKHYNQELGLMEQFPLKVFLEKFDLLMHDYAVALLFADCVPHEIPLEEQRIKLFFHTMLYNSSSVRRDYFSMKAQPVSILQIDRYTKILQEFTGLSEEIWPSETWNYFRKNCDFGGLEKELRAAVEKGNANTGVLEPILNKFLSQEGFGPQISLYLDKRARPYKDSDPQDKFSYGNAKEKEDAFKKEAVQIDNHLEPACRGGITLSWQVVAIIARLFQAGVSLFPQDAKYSDTETPSFTRYCEFCSWSVECHIGSNIAKSSKLSGLVWQIIQEKMKAKFQNPATKLQKTTWPAGSKDISISGFWRRHNMRYENFQELIDA